MESNRRPLNGPDPLASVALRSDRNAIRVPSGDHFGIVSLAGCRLRLRRPDPSGLITYISSLPSRPVTNVIGLSADSCPAADPHMRRSSARQAMRGNRAARCTALWVPALARASGVGSMGNYLPGMNFT